MKKQFYFSKKLAGYSTLAGAVLAGVGANAQPIVYTDIPDITIGGVAPVAFPYTDADSIDLNNDGIFDFEIKMKIMGTNAGGGFNFYESMVGINDVIYNRIVSYTVEYHPYVNRFDCGDSIPNSLAAFNFSPFAEFANKSDVDSIFAWQNDVNKYAGVQSKINGAVHFGWVRLDVNNMGNIPVVVIKGYAYNNTAMQLIAACDTGWPASINNALLESKVEVFPNPTADQLHITLPSSVDEVSVMNMLGEIILERKNSSSNHISLDVSALPEGNYFVELKSAEGIVVKKFSVQR